MVESLQGSENYKGLGVKGLGVRVWGLGFG